MAVSYPVSEVDKRGGVGIQLGVIRAYLVKTLSKLSLVAPVFWVRVETRLVDRKSSQPLLIAIPGPEG